MRSRSISSRYPKVLWVILAVALLLRLLFVWHHHLMGYQLRSDPGVYLALAANMKYGVYSMFHPMDIPDTTRMPGYPFLIYVLGESVPLTLVLQTIVSSLKVLLVFRIAIMVGLREPHALMAAVLMALEPMDVMLSGQILTETCFTTCLLLGVYLLMRGDGLRDLLIAAICFATATWIRPNGLFVLLLVGVLAAWLMRHKTSRVFGMLSLALVLILPWAVRNWNVTGRPVLTDAGAVAAAYFHVPKVMRSASEQEALTYEKGLRTKAANMDWESKGAVAEFMRALRKDVRNVLQQRPLAWARAHVVTSIRIFLAPGRGHISRFFSSSQVLGMSVLLVSMLYSIAIVLFALGSAIQVRRIPQGIWTIILLSAFILFTAGISTADARFKNPAMPLLLVGVAWMAEIVHGTWRAGRIST